MKTEVWCYDQQVVEVAVLYVEPVATFLWKHQVSKGYLLISSGGRLESVEERVVELVECTELFNCMLMLYKML